MGRRSSFPRVGLITNTILGTGLTPTPYAGVESRGEVGYARWSRAVTHEVHGAQSRRSLRVLGGTSRSACGGRVGCGEHGSQLIRAPGHRRCVVPERCQRRPFHEQGTAAQDDREVQQLRSAQPRQHGPQQGDCLVGVQSPWDRAPRPLTSVQALRLVPAHRFQARTRSRYRRRGRAERRPAPAGRR